MRRGWRRSTRPTCTPDGGAVLVGGQPPSARRLSAWLRPSQTAQSRWSRSESPVLGCANTSSAPWFSASRHDLGELRRRESDLVAPARVRPHQLLVEAAHLHPVAEARDDAFAQRVGRVPAGRVEIRGRASRSRRRARSRYQSCSCSCWLGQPLAAGGGARLSRRPAWRDGPALPAPARRVRGGLPGSRSRRPDGAAAAAGAALPSCSSAGPAIGRPRTSVTLLPPRPLLSRQMRATPSPAGRGGGRRSRRRAAAGGHMRPPSVE